jgi:hypothetical protein
MVVSKDKCLICIDKRENKNYTVKIYKIWKLKQ